MICFGVYGWGLHSERAVDLVSLKESGISWPGTEYNTSVLVGSRVVNATNGKGTRPYRACTEYTRLQPPLRDAYTMSTHACIMHAPLTRKRAGIDEPPDQWTSRIVLRCKKPPIEKMKWPLSTPQRGLRSEWDCAWRMMVGWGRKRCQRLNRRAMQDIFPWAWSFDYRVVDRLVDGGLRESCPPTRGYDHAWPPPSSSLFFILTLWGLYKSECI
jgi:hypothetical protein